MGKFDPIMIEPTISFAVAPACPDCGTSVADNQVFDVEQIQPPVIKSERSVILHVTIERRPRRACHLASADGSQNVVSADALQPAQYRDVRLIYRFEVG